MKSTNRALILDRVFTAFASAARAAVRPDEMVMPPIVAESSRRIRATKRKGRPGYVAHVVNPAGSKAHRLGRNV